MIKFFSKIKIKLLVFFLIVLIIGVTVYLLSGYFKKVTEEKRIINSICQDSFNDPSKWIDPEADYVSVWYWKDFLKKPFQKNSSFLDYIWASYWESSSAFSPLKKFVNLSQQYDACRLFLDGGYGQDSFFKLVSEEDRQELLKSFNTSWLINEIALSQNCNSPRIKSLVDLLPNLGIDFKNRDINGMCNLLHNQVSDEEIRDFCLNDEICFIAAKADPFLIQENQDLIDNRRFNFVWYLAAIKNNNKDFCPEPTHIRLFQESFPRIPCQIYFIKNNPNYCDLIYNEIKQDFCKS